MRFSILRQPICRFCVLCHMGHLTSYGPISCVPPKKYSANTPMLFALIEDGPIQKGVVRCKTDSQQVIILYAK